MENTDSPYVGMFHYRRFLSLNDNARYPMLEFPSMRFRHLGLRHLNGFAKEFLHDLELEKNISCRGLPHTTFWYPSR